MFAHKKFSVRRHARNGNTLPNAVAEISVGWGGGGFNWPKGKINWPKDKINRPKDKINWPKDKINWPKDKINSPKIKLTGPKIKLTGPKIKLTGPKIKLTGPKIKLTGPKQWRKFRWGGGGGDFMSHDARNSHTSPPYLNYKQKMSVHTSSR